MISVEGGGGGEGEEGWWEKQIQMRRCLLKKDNFSIIKPLKVKWKLYYVSYVSVTENN